MPTQFHIPKDNVSGVVASARSAGAPITVQDGTPFGTSFPIIISIARQSGQTFTDICTLEVTGKTGAILTVSGAVDGTTDADLLVGDIVEMRPTALALTEIHTAVNALETAKATDETNIAANTSAISSHVANISNPHSVTKSQVGLGNVDNISDANKPVSTLQQAALDLKANLASPGLTGVPTTPTAAQGTNTTQVASAAFVRGEIAALVASAPSILDTLGEIATALQADESTASALATTVAGKAPLVHTHAAADIVSGVLATARLGSGSASATTFLRGDQAYAVPAATVASGTSGRVPFETTGGVLTDSANLTYSSGSGVLTTFGPTVGGSFDNGLLQCRNSTNTTKVLNFGIDTSVGTYGYGWLQVVNSGVATMPLILQPGGGSVGLGTNNPGAIFDVRTNSTYPLTWGSTSTQIGALVYSGTAATLVGFTGDIALLPLGTEVFRVSTSGQAALVASPVGSVQGLVIRGATSQTAPLLPLQGISSTSTARDLGYVDAVFAGGVTTDASFLGEIRLIVQDYGNNSGGNPSGRLGLKCVSNGTNADVVIPIANVRNAVDDTAAAALSPAVPVGGIYRNGSVLMIRVS